MQTPDENNDDPDAELPYVQRMFQKKSYLGEACNLAIREVLFKI